MPGDHEFGNHRQQPQLLLVFNWDMEQSPASLVGSHEVMAPFQTAMRRETEIVVGAFFNFLADCRCRL
jgi:hypothetical protein